MKDLGHSERHKLGPISVVYDVAVGRQSHLDPKVHHLFYIDRFWFMSFTMSEIFHLHERLPVLLEISHHEIKN